MFEGGLIGDANSNVFVAKTNQIKNLKENLFGAAIGVNSASY